MSRAQPCLVTTLDLPEHRSVSMYSPYGCFHVTRYLGVSVDSPSGCFHVTRYLGVSVDSPSGCFHVTRYLGVSVDSPSGCFHVTRYLGVSVDSPSGCFHVTHYLGVSVDSPSGCFSRCALSPAWDQNVAPHTSQRCRESAGPVSSSGCTWCSLCMCEAYSDCVTNGAPHSEQSYCSCN